ncbi:MULTISPECIES: hypothetical protein [unclassified Roseitalea]|uniref:hypothetical protein n=1 Tax=unclassified Roseitalea TaxID=2639107 RepID=UPI00273DF214|nr:MULTISPECIES: hypothetical protein [unclassified Roseitalea]
MVGAGRIVEDITVRLLATAEWLTRRAGAFSAPLGLAIMLAFTATVAVVAWVFPVHNWDMLAYLAAAHEAPGVSVEALHAHAYDTVRQNVPAGDFLVLTQDRDYRIAQQADPAAFHSMLGFYRVKVLYVEATRWLSGLVDPYTALRLLAVVPAFAIGIAMTLWLARERALHLAPLALALAMAAQFGEVARQTTPDALSAMFLIGGMLAFLARREALTAGLLLLAFLARPDHLAYLGVLMVVALFARSFSWGVTAAFLAGLIAYGPMTMGADHPGWWVHYWFTNVEYVPTLVGFDPEFSIAVYLDAQVRVLVRSLVEQSWLAVLIVGGFAWWQMALRGIAFSRRQTAVLATTMLAIGAKTVVFPLYDTRFHFAYLVVFGLVLIGALRDLRFVPAAIAR